jgi:hypothetical protein
LREEKPKVFAHRSLLVMTGRPSETPSRLPSRPIASFAVAFAFLHDSIETPPHNLSNRQQMPMRPSAAIVHFRA